MTKRTSEFNPRQYWEARLSGDCGLADVGFRGLGKSYNAWLYRVRRRVFMRLMRAQRLNFPVLDVLDVGSGTGFYLDCLTELGVHNLVGCDIASFVVGSLTEKYPAHEFIQLDIGGNIERLKLRRFDIISAFDVLFHIVDDSGYERAIHNISALLKPGGLFVFSENFLRGHTVRAEHQVSRPLEEIEHLLEEAGFDIEERWPMFYLMNYPIDSHSSVAQRAWQLMARMIAQHDGLGFLIGALLFPLELCCVRLCREGPSTEVMICSKSAR
jgi:SAM-dependent methyltransferase